MSKEQIIYAQKGLYPFQKAQPYPCQNTLFLVKFDDQYRNDAQYNISKEKLNYRKHLQHSNLISLSHSLQEPGKIHNYYEYVHLQMSQSWAQTIGQEFFEKIKEEMISLARYLHKNKILFSFNPKNIGITSQMSAKYFLENFQIQETDDGVSGELAVVQINKFFQKLMSKEKENQKQPKQKIEIQMKKQQSQPLSYKELEKKLEDRRKKSLEALQKLKRNGC